MKQRRTRTKIIVKLRGISMAPTRCNQRNYEDDNDIL